MSVLSKTAVCGLLGLAAVPSLASPVVAQCTSTVIWSEDFEGGLPPGWSTTSLWHILPKGSCGGPACLNGMTAQYVQPGTCDCAIGTSGCWTPGFLSTAPIALPAVASNEKIALEFCHELNLWNLFYLELPEIYIEHPLGTLELPLGVPGKVYDLTAFRGQTILIRWRWGFIDNESHGRLELDDARIVVYGGSGGDCNQNVLPDSCDIQAGTSADCNVNGVPDECELASGAATDCNANGVLDVCDIAAGVSTDCNGNLLPDECELNPAFNDCNGNGVLDECDIASGTSHDFDADGIPDECQCSSLIYCLGAPNSAGPGAQIAVQGSTSKTLNDTYLSVSGAPPGQIGIFYYGDFKTQVPFGEGWKCVAGQIVRLLPSVPLGPTGSGSYFLDLQGPPPAGSITAGSTFDFQFWYRDPLGGGVGFNLSNAVEILFCP